MTKIILAEIERRPTALTADERARIVGVVRVLANEVDLLSAGGDVGRNILARHGIVMEPEKGDF